jgi:hypothetical protein
MKNTLILIFILFAQTLFGQEFLKNDSILRKVNSELPEGWEMKMEGTTLSIEKKDSVWVIFTNHINEAPKGINYKEPTESELKTKFEKEGKKMKYSITYRVESRCNETEKLKAKLRNDSINVLVDQLWEKYKIEKFYHRAKVINGKSRENDRFEPKTSADSLQLKNFNNEKAVVEKRLIRMPDKCTQKYSLFAISEYCFDSVHNNPGFSDTFPKEADNEWSQVCGIIYKYCICK